MEASLIPATEEDVGPLVDLINRINAADAIPMAVVADELMETLGGPNMDPRRDTRLAVVDGRAIGYLLVHYRPSGQSEEKTYLQGGVDPEHRRRGVGSALLEWGLERARVRLATVDNDLPRVMRADSYAWQEDQLALHRSFGLKPARWFFEMLRPLAPLPESQHVDGIDIHPWQARHSEPARLTHNAAFRDHWGSIPADTATWEHWMATYGTRHDLSYVAYDGELMVGYALNAHYPDDAALHGRLEGWIESLGTLQGHRGRGIASALLVASMRAFAAAGFDHAALGVDSDSPTGAHRLYTSLGFVTDRQTVVSQRRYLPG